MANLYISLSVAQTSYPNIAWHQCFLTRVFLEMCLTSVFVLSNYGMVGSVEGEAFELFPNILIENNGKWIFWQYGG